MHSDLGITVLVIHFADGRTKLLSGGYFTHLLWWPALLWGPGAWRYLANDNDIAGPVVRAPRGSRPGR